MKKKIIFSLLFLFLFFTIGIVFSTLYIQNTTTALERLINLHQIENLRQHLIMSIQTVQSELYTVGTPLGDKLDVITDNMSLLDENAAKCTGCHHTPQIENKLRETQAFIGDYKEALSYYITASANRENIDRLKLKAAEIGNKLFTITEQMSLDASRKLAFMTNEALERARLVRMVLIVTIILTFIFALLIAFRLTKSITYPISVLVNATRAIASGNLDYLVSYQDKTEFGELANNFNLMSTALKDGYTELEEDIAQRKKVEEALISAKEEWERTFDAVPDLIALIDSEHRIVRVNRAMAGRFNRMPEQLIGRRCYEVMHNATTPPEYCPHARLLISGNEERSEFLDDKLGGYFEERTTPVHSKTGQLIASVHIVRDITEHRKLEEQLRQAQKMEGIGQLAGGVAHDFNNILSAIIGYGHLSLLKMEEDDPNRQNLEQILEASDRAAHLTKDLLVFSRKQPIDKKPVELNGIIRRVEKFLKRVIGEDIEFHTRYSEQRLMVSADSHQIEQVLMNLATNARDAMPKGGAFTITTEEVNPDKEFITLKGLGKTGRYALISTSDTGYGMDDLTSKRIFEPFYTTKEVGKGTGLGLAVVYGIIQQHNGYITVYSEQGMGSTFKIYLPLIDEAGVEDKAAADEELAVGGTETVLLAEDDESVRKLSHRIMTKYGYTVIEAVDGKDAVQKYRENMKRIDLLLFDLVMPRMTGKEAYDEIRKLQPDIKVIFASGYSPDIVQQKMAIEMDVTLISKPVSPFYLLKKMREVLDEGKR